MERAKSSEEGGFYYCLYSIVMSAFSFEAFLNHLGSDHVEKWDKYMPVLDKLKFLANQKGIVVDYAKSPFQSIKESNQVRNDLAHGVTEKLNKCYSINNSRKTRIGLQTTWEMKCTLSRASRILADTELVMKEMFRAFNNGSELLLGILSLGSTLTTTRVNEKFSSFSN